MVGSRRLVEWVHMDKNAEDAGKELREEVISVVRQGSVACALASRSNGSIRWNSRLIRHCT